MVVLAADDRRLELGDIDRVAGAVRVLRAGTAVWPADRMRSSSSNSSIGWPSINSTRCSGLLPTLPK